MSDEPKKLKDGRYVLLRKLGEGSQGETYEALDDAANPGERKLPLRDSRLADDWARFLRNAKTDTAKDKIPRAARLVAIKCFRLGKAKAWKDVELAEREANTLASLDHPRLPRYIEHFEEDGALYLVMEKIEGESVAALRGAKRTWTVAEVTRMLEDIGEALTYLQSRSPFIVHRDIKPGNVIRRPDGSFALVDFGAVRDRLKPAGGSTVVGTFGYMAPEQFQGRASPKSDLYGLGATALAMLTGEEPESLPHEGLGIDVARAVPRGTPAPLVRALAAMLAPDPDRRIDSIGDALAFLRATDKRSSAPPQKSEPPAQLTRRQKRELRNRERKAEREARKLRRAAARARQLPLLPRLVAKVGLLAAFIVVWAVVGVVLPLVLSLLSLLFGKAMRQAANACVRGAMSAQRSLGRASDWVSGHRDTVAEPPDADAAPRVRVVSELDRVRAVTETEAQALAMAQAARSVDPDVWLAERIAREQAHLEASEELDDFDQRLRRQSAPPSAGKSSAPPAKRRP